MKRIVVLIATLAVAFTGAVYAADEIKAAGLGELLELVKKGQLLNRAENKAREAKFNRNKNQQRSELNKAKASQRREEANSERLEGQFEKNETALAVLSERLKKRLGSLSELFGVLQQVSGDTQGVFEGSIISAEFPGRTTWLSQFAQDMGNNTKLATIEEIERLWFEVQREMTESGKTSRFTANVNKLDGERKEQEILRIGAYSLISEGQYLDYDRANGVINELAAQPAGRFVNTAAALQEAQSGFVAFAIDPTKGQLLSLQKDIPSIQERIHHGGLPGYVILALGLAGLLLSIERMITLGITASKVRSQINNTTPNKNNPLGRVLSVYHENKGVDSETLQLQLDEAILKESPAINTRIAFIKIISMVAPLLGLLGTVIGMIVTFQAITLFGTGDPKTMAGGISQALITTVLGLVVAIPMVLLHAIVQSRSSVVMHILVEQSAGLIAQHAESAGK